MAQVHQFAVRQAAPISTPAFAPMSASRMLVIGGIGLIVAGLILGDVFAVFILHQNANRIGERMLAAVAAVSANKPEDVKTAFGSIGEFLENRGTKVDAHVHIIDFGYLALLLALLQPYVAMDEQRKRQLASVFLAGAVMLPVGVFAIHYVGLKYSPLSAIGWASMVADFGGLLVVVASAGMGLGVLAHVRSNDRVQHPLMHETSWSARALLAGGSLLVLAGFVHGAWYSWSDLYRLEGRESRILSSMISAAAERSPAATAAVNDYGLLQAEKAVKIAAHSHVIEFGILAMLLALVQPYVFLSETWRRRWAVLLLAGGLILPVFVLQELKWGLVAGGIADFGGLLVVIALIGMLAGIVRYTGRVNGEARVV